MSPKAELFNREYFDQAGNQRKLFPGDVFIQRDPEPEEPEERYIADTAKSNVKTIDEFIQAMKHYNALVTKANNESRYAGGGNTRGDERWNRALRACDAFEPTYNKAKDAAEDVLYPIVKRLFPEFEIDDSDKDPRTQLGYFTTEVGGHVFLYVVTHDKNDYWNKIYSVIVRDDGLVLPEFGKIFKSKAERTEAWNNFRNAAKQAPKKESENVNESVNVFQKIKTIASEFAKTVKVVFSDMTKYKNDAGFAKTLLGKFKAEGSVTNLTNEERLVAVAFIAESPSPLGKPEEDLKIALAKLICDEKPLSPEIKNLAYAYLKTAIADKRAA